MASVKRTTETLDILKSYQGENPYILTLKRDVCINGREISDFICDYVLRNHQIKPKRIDKIIRIADWYGESRQKELGIDFTPKKLKIITYLGDTPISYHCFVQYRKSVEPAMWFVPKKAVLTNFLVEDYSKIEVDFDRYDRLSNFQRILFDHQKEAVKFLLSRKKCILADEQGLGKLEPNSSLIPTPNGFKRMGDIKIGDNVFGEDGKPHKVIKTYPHKNKAIYKVTFNDGTFTYCGLEHLWKVRDANMRTRKQGWAVLTTEELLKRKLKRKEEKETQRGRCYYEIPVTEPVEYQEKEFFIHPYILGLCIGDAYMKKGIHISIPDFEFESVERVKTFLNENYTLSKNDAPACPNYLICQKTITPINEYNREIKRLGLNVRGNEKFIPEEYKLGSIEQRLYLLRGLMDSDGAIRPNNKVAFFTNSNKLAEDVRELVFSLGGIARISSYDRKKEGKNIEYHVRIQIKENPFLLKRKSEQFHPIQENKYCKRHIFSIEYDHIEDATCLMVDYDEHTYLTGKNYAVTHNTTALSVAAIEGNFDSVLVVCPASLKGNWKRELSFYIPEKDITIIDRFDDKTKAELEEFLGYAPGKSNMKRDELLAEAKARGQWKFNRFVIINYDILDKFFVAKRTYTQKQFDEMLEQSPLLQFIHNRKSLIIIDEAHELSNSKSIRYKTIRGLIRKGNPDSIYLATGTPITNNPANFFCVLNLIENEVTGDWEFYMKHYCGAIELFKDKAERDRWTRKYLDEHEKKSWYDLNSEEKQDLNKFLREHCEYNIIPKDPMNLDELSERVSHIYLRREKDILTLPNKTVHEIYYELNAAQRQEYETLWEEYEAEKKNEEPEKELNKNLLEGAIYRQYLSKQMIPHTIKLAEEIISNGEKVVIGCCFDEELYTLQEHFGDKCVIYNGKMSLKEKDNAIVKFMGNENIKVFIGNLIAAGVGITLISASKLIFNDFSYVSGDNLQFSDRIHRIGQKKDVDIYYQIFNDTQYEKMWEITLRKQITIDTVIRKEDDKKYS